MAELEATFRCPVIESYGMTEAAHQMASNPLPPRARKPGSVGLAAGPEMAIMASDGRLLGAGEVGEIVIRGRERHRRLREQPEGQRARPSPMAGSTPATRARWTPKAMSASPAG